MSEVPLQGMGVRVYPPDLGQLDQRHVRQRRVHLAGSRLQGLGFNFHGRHHYM